MSEILLGVRRFPQPIPHKNAGGDCFACALTAAVNFLFPEKPVAFDDVWNCFLVQASDGKPLLSNCWPTMYRAICELRSRGYAIEHRRDIVLPVFDVDTWSHSWWHAEPTHEWACRLEAWLSAGWVALAEMNLDGKGLFNADGTMNAIDHFAVLDGQRHYWKKHPTVEGAASLSHETHV